MIFLRKNRKQKKTVSQNVHFSLNNEELNRIKGGADGDPINPPVPPPPPPTGKG